MEIATIPTAQEFLARTAEFRSREPYLTNVMGSVAVGAVQGREYESCHWWVAVDAGQIVGAAVRTVPYKLLLAPMAAEVNQAMAEEVAKTFPQLQGVSGPFTQIATYEQVLRPKVTVTGMTEIVYVLSGYEPASVSGFARRTTEADRPLIDDWLRQFHIDAGLPQYDGRAGLERMLTCGWLWINPDGEPTAMAGHAPTVEVSGSFVGRIGPVFTPLGQRRRGYGAAVTGAVIEELQRGCTHIMLYADADNATSNGVYQRLGFIEYARLAQTEFVYE